MGTDLVRYEEACKAVAAAKTTAQANSIRKDAEAMQLFARQAKNKQMQVDAAEIQLLAERRLGEIIKAQKETVGLAKGGGDTSTGSRKVPVQEPPTLADAGIDKKLSSKAQKLADMPEDEFKEELAGWRTQVERSGERVTTNLLKKKKKKKKADRKAAVPVDLPPITDRYKLIHSDLNEAPIETESIDCIITDPPYPREFIHCYETLAYKAVEWLKPGGSLLAMAGQSYLPQVLRAMAVDGLSYHWTLAYLTPGGQSVQVFPRKVNTFWKPVLWFVKGKHGGDWIGDVAKSDPNDNDKRHHHWGQSESGMVDLVERFTDPGQTVCDPFLGGGTTGVVCVEMNRLFVGVEIDRAAYETALNRMAQCQNETTAA